MDPTVGLNSFMNLLDEIEMQIKIVINARGQDGSWYVVVVRD